MVIDLLLSGSERSLNTSPTTPSSPSQAQQPSMGPASAGSSSRFPAGLQHPANLPAIPCRNDQLTRLKILMREGDHKPRTRKARLAPTPAPTSKAPAGVQSTPGSSTTSGNPATGSEVATGTASTGGESAEGLTEGLGTSEGTIRFLFLRGPVVGSADNVETS